MDDQVKVVSCVVKNPEGKGYLLVDGKPFLYQGIQNLGILQCLCDQADSPFQVPLPISWLENVFEKTQALGYKTILPILQWSDIEHTNTPGIYDWTLIDKYVDWCNKYDLHLDILWTGSIVCGGAMLTEYKFGYRTTVPPYLQDLDKYFGDGDSQVGAVHCPWLVGRCPEHDVAAQFIQDCEYNAVKALFNHLATYDQNHRTILFQVENEPNFHSQWESNKPLVLNHLNAIGKAVKDSKYIVATRVNLTGTSADSDVSQLQYIDFVGPDPYMTSVSMIENIINDTSKSDLVYIAENDSGFGNTSSLVVTALVNGGFYEAFELNDNWCSQGIYDPSIHFYQWTLGTIPPFLPQGTCMKNLNTAINKIGSLVACTSKKSMIGFNIESDIPATNYISFKSIGDIGIGCLSKDASVGMVVRADNYLYCISDTSGSITYKTDKHPISVTKGNLDESGIWVIDETKSYTNSDDGTYMITYNSQECLRIEFSI